MRFKIRRTSKWDDTKPCEEAYILQGVHDPNAWYQKWSIDINTLEDLIAFSKKYGDLVIITNGEKSIEIYDTYRE